MVKCENTVFYTKSINKFGTAIDYIIHESNYLKRLRKN